VVNKGIGATMSKEAWLQVRTTEDDKRLAKDLAKDYGVSLSELIRFALKHLDEQRPSFTVTYTLEGKASA
jgi:replication initiation and membrane attachment protein DnaB